jgi:sulfur-carrier protein
MGTNRAPRRASALNVQLDGWLQEFGPGACEKVRAKSLGQVLDVLEQRYPRFRFKVRDEAGHVRRHVRLFVDGEEVTGATGLDTVLNGAKTVDILHSISGG